MREGPVVVGVSGSESSLDALDTAASLAGHLDRLLVAVHVRRVAATWEPLVAAAFAAWQAANAEVASDCRMSCELALAARAVDWRYEVRHGDPAHELMGVARHLDAACVAIGSGRHRGLAEVGSVGGRVLHAADRPVLVVPSRA